MYKALVVESRPKLRSANVFLILNDGSLETKIVLNVDSFKIVQGEKYCVVVPLQFVNAIPNSLSCLKISNGYVSFRFATQVSLDSNSGSFRTEIIQNKPNSSNFNNEKSRLVTNCEYTINCKNCTKILTVPEKVKFNRILPLPSENMDFSEWFCHADKNTNFSLDPKNSDVFYSSCYMHLNRNNVLNIRISDKVVVCKFCFNWLGLQLNENTLKLWFNTIRFLSDSTEITSDRITDIYCSIRNVFNSSMYNSLKINLECYSSPKKIDNILIWVLEKELEIIYEESNNQRNLCSVAKVLFKFIKEEEKDKDILRHWQNDSMVNNINVSKPMFVEALKLLHKYNKIFPPEFARSNDFLISYIFLYEQ